MHKVRAPVIAQQYKLIALFVKNSYNNNNNNNNGLFDLAARAGSVTKSTYMHIEPK